MSGPVRVVAASLAAGALAGSVVLSLIWATGPRAYWFVVLTAIVPLALPGYLLAGALLAWLSRRARRPVRRWYRGGAVLALLGAGLHAVVALPAYTGAHPGGEPDLVVMTVNVHLGEADAGRTVALARAERPDVLVLVEMRPELRAALHEEGLDDLLPFTVTGPGTGSSGTVVFSRHPLTDHVRIPVITGAHRVRVLAPQPFWLVAVHTSQPLTRPQPWAQDWDAVLGEVRGLKGPTVIAGDFNATLEHWPVRELLDLGYADAARRSNAGWQPTWPTELGDTRIPGDHGLITIDHVLFNDGFDAIRTRTAPLPGTDHRALVADLVRR